MKKKFWDIQSAGWKAGGLPSKTAPRASAGACAAFLAKPKFDVCTKCSIFFSPYDPVTQRSTDVCWKRNFEFKGLSKTYVKLIFVSIGSRSVLFETV